MVVTQKMEKTLSLVKQFVEHSESFIADQLNGWGSRFFLHHPAHQRSLCPSRGIFNLLNCSLRV